MAAFQFSAGRPVISRSAEFPRAAFPSAQASPEFDVVPHCRRQLRGQDCRIALRDCAGAARRQRSRLAGFATVVKWPTQTTTRPLFANRGPVPTVAHLVATIQAGKGHHGAAALHIVFNKQPRLGLLERRAAVVSKSDHVLRGHHRRPSTPL
jgi:hypothetical protein